MPYEVIAKIRLNIIRILIEFSFLNFDYKTALLICRLADQLQPQQANQLANHHQLQQAHQLVN